MEQHRFLSQTPTYKAWRGMLNRCYSPTNKDYPATGGAGIIVHEAWHEYEQFVADVGEKPDNTILVRLNPKGNFEPGNVEWASKVDSRRNPLYTIWKSMRRRCGVIGAASANKSAASYAQGGISICPDWADSFASFAADVGERPSPDHQLDRIDNNQGYWPGNVRWVDRKTNANNTSGNVVIEMWGERRTLQQWCDHFGVSRVLVSSRWRNLFAPTQGRNRVVEQLTITGQLVQRHKNVREAAAATGIKQGTIAKCLSGGNASAGGYLWRYVDA